jgi:hypothetical protein
MVDLSNDYHLEGVHGEKYTHLRMMLLSWTKTPQVTIYLLDQNEALLRQTILP